MGQTTIALEVMDNNQTWQDVTTDSMSIMGRVGMGQSRRTAPHIGTCNIRLNNRSKTYNPDLSNWSSALLEIERRIRLKVTTANMGKCLSIQQTRVNASTDQCGIKNVTHVAAAVNDVFVLSFQARAQFDSQFNNDPRVLVENFNTGVEKEFAIQSFFYTNKWQTYSITLTATQVGTDIQIRFDSSFPVLGADGKNSKTLEYKNVTLTKNGGANILSNGDFSNGLTGWTTYTNGGNTVTTTVINDYTIKFNGFITKVTPTPFANAGIYYTDIECVDFVSLIENYRVNLAIQKNKTGDQLNTLALAPMTSYKTVILLDSPTGYYRLGEASGATVLDSSGNNLSGTYANATLGATGLVIGDTDTAASFNGTNTQITLSPSPLTVKTQMAFTIEMWVNLASLPSSAYALVWNGNPGTAESGVLIYIQSSGQVITSFFSDDAGSIITLSAGKASHIAWVYDGAKSFIYINGALGNSKTQGPYIGTADSWVLGQQQSAWFLNGTMDEVAFYTRALSATDVARHYNAGIAKYNMSRIPGILQDTGKQTFPIAFDGYTDTAVFVADVATDVSDSEYGVQWIDCDGTFRWMARDGIPKLIVTAPKLSLTDGQAYTMTVDRDGSPVRNDAAITYKPRSTGAQTVLGQITTPIAIPPVQANGVPGRYVVTLTFRDTTSNVVGGDSVVTTLVASTDYTINHSADGTGTDYTTNSLFRIGAVTSDASQATIELKNFSSDILYATKLQIRGNPITAYDPVVIHHFDPDSILTYQRQPWVKAMPFSNDANLMDSLANYVIRQFKNPFAEVTVVQADYKAQIAGVDLLSLELMDMLSISASWIGMTNLKHIIVDIAFSFQTNAQDYIGQIIFTTERLDQNTYWVLQNSTYGVLDSTAMLYI